MTEQELIQALIEKQNNAFELLVNQYKTVVIRVCFNLLNNREDAEDVAQEVFIEVFRSIDRFRVESKISTWLYRISVNKSINFLKNKRNKRWMSLFEFGYGEDDSEIENARISDIENEYVKNETEKLLDKAIDSLPINQKTAFTLHKFEDLSYKEISEAMKLSLSAVESLIHRAKRNLQKSLYSYYKKSRL